MKRFVASTLTWSLVGSAVVQAQAPLYPPAIAPASLSSPASSPSAPGRLHMGGALTREGVVPVPVFLNDNARASESATSPAASAAPLAPASPSPRLAAPAPAALLPMPSTAGKSGRVHMAGALTREGIVPVPVFFERQARQSQSGLADVASAAKAPGPRLPADVSLPQTLPVSAAPPALPAPQGLMPPGNAPRVHFGGALTVGGVVPVPAYLHSNARGSRTLINLAPGVVPSSQALRGNGGPPVHLTSLNDDISQGPTADGGAACVDDSCGFPFYPPSMDDMRRPQREPHGHHFYTTLEYLHWWVRRQASPPLVIVGGDSISAGDFDGSTRDGGRFIMGCWLGSDTPMAIEGVFLFLGEQHKGRTVSSNGFPAIGRPITDAATGTLITVPIADVGVPGAVNMETQARLFGFEVNLRRELYRTGGGHLDFLLGYRQLHLDEGLRVTDSTGFADTSVIGVDQFGTHNQIFAGQLGLEAELSWWRVFVDLWGKFGLGGNRQTVNVNGYTRVVSPAGSQTETGDVLAQPSNIGRFRDNSFSVIPEVGVNFGFRVTNNWRVAAGYSALFIGNVVRPGDQIDPVFSPAGSRPAPPIFNESSYWAHGLNAQMEIRY